MVFYPDNEKRATRLQQLVDSMANMQTDVKRIAEKMDRKNAEYRPVIDKLLKEKGIDSVDDVINKAAAEMTPDERKVFEALIKTIKDSGKAGIDITNSLSLSASRLPWFSVLLSLAHWHTTHLGLPIGKVATSIAGWGLRTVNVNALAEFFTATEAGTGIAASVAKEVATGAENAEKIIQEIGEVGEEVSKATIRLGRIGTFFKVLGAVGFVVTIIVGIVELVKGAGQKEKLIDAIQGLQPARLTTAFFKQEGENIYSQLVTLQLYLDASPGGSDPDPDMAARIAKKLIKSITEENKAIDLNKLELELETQDRTSTLFYGGDDLSHNEVVAIASKTK